MPNFDESKGFKLKSGNTPLFKQIGTPAKNYSVEKGSHDHPHEESPATMYGETPVKHTRRREGHMDTYGTHTNADHPNYWKKGEDGKTPKSKEIAAGKKSTTKTNTKTNTENNTENKSTKKKKRNVFSRLEKALRIKDTKGKVVVGKERLRKQKEKTDKFKFM